MKDKAFVFLFATAVAMGTGCGDNLDSVPGVDAGDGDASTACGVTPGAWSAPSFATNAATALALRAQIDALAAGSGVMRAGEQTPAADVEMTDLTTAYQAGDTSMASIVGTEFDAILQDAFADFVAIDTAGPQDLFEDTTDMWNPLTTDGGLYASSPRGINFGGIEVRQIADKGTYAAVLYRHALSLTEATIDEATIDAIAAAFGSNATLDSGDPTDSANYAFAMGFHGAVATALTEAKAYAGDDRCDAERDAALVEVFRNWEKALYARLLFYANAGATELAAAADDDTRASALHEYAEGLGLGIGFYGVPDPSAGPLMGAGKIITDTEIEDLMTTLGVDITDLSASTIGSDFTVTPANMATAAANAEASLMTIFGFTQAEIEGFRNPTEG